MGITYEMFNSCSLSLYDKCLKVESILVALLCTFSIIGITYEMFNSCSLSLYDKCLRVESFLVALLCTFSIIRICFLSTGNQIKSP